MRLDQDARHFALAVHLASGVCADEVLAILRHAQTRLTSEQQAALVAYCESETQPQAAQLLGCTKQALGYRLWGQLRKGRIRSPGVFERLLACLTEAEYEDLRFWSALQRRFLLKECPDQEETMFERMSNVHFYCTEE